MYVVTPVLDIGFGGMEDSAGFGWATEGALCRNGEDLGKNTSGVHRGEKSWVLTWSFRI